jgi:hypothetical protein
MVHLVGVQPLHKSIAEVGRSAAADVPCEVDAREGRMISSVTVTANVFSVARSS